MAILPIQARTRCAPTLVAAFMLTPLKVHKCARVVPPAATSLCSATPMGPFRFANSKCIEAWRLCVLLLAQVQHGPLEVAREVAGTGTVLQLRLLALMATWALGASEIPVTAPTTFCKFPRHHRWHGGCWTLEARCQLHMSLYGVATTVATIRAQRSRSPSATPVIQQLQTRCAPTLLAAFMLPLQVQKCVQVVSMAGTSL